MWKAFWYTIRIIFHVEVLFTDNDYKWKSSNFYYEKNHELAVLHFTNYKFQK